MNMFLSLKDTSDLIRLGFHKRKEDVGHTLGVETHGEGGKGTPLKAEKIVVHPIENSKIVTDTLNSSSTENNSPLTERIIRQNDMLLNLFKTSMKREKKYFLKNEIFRKRLIEAILDSGQETADAIENDGGGLIPKLLKLGAILGAGALGAGALLRSALGRQKTPKPKFSSRFDNKGHFETEEKRKPKVSSRFDNKGEIKKSTAPDVQYRAPEIQTAKAGTSESHTARAASLNSSTGSIDRDIGTKPLATEIASDVQQTASKPPRVATPKTLNVLTESPKLQPPPKTEASTRVETPTRPVSASKPPIISTEPTKVETPTRPVSTSKPPIISTGPSKSPKVANLPGQIGRGVKAFKRGGLTFLHYATGTTPFAVGLTVADMALSATPVGDGTLAGPITQAVRQAQIHVLEEGGSPESIETAIKFLKPHLETYEAVIRTENLDKNPVQFTTGNTATGIKTSFINPKDIITKKFWEDYWDSQPESEVVIEANTRRIEDKKSQAFESGQVISDDSFALQRKPNKAIPGPIQRTPSDPSYNNVITPESTTLESLESTWSEEDIKRYNTLQNAQEKLFFDENGGLRTRTSQQQKTYDANEVEIKKLERKYGGSPNASGIGNIKSRGAGNYSLSGGNFQFSATQSVFDDSGNYRTASSSGGWEDFIRWTDSNRETLEETLEETINQSENIKTVGEETNEKLQEVVDILKNMPGIGYISTPYSTPVNSTPYSTPVNFFPNTGTLPNVSENQRQVANSIATSRHLKNSKFADADYYKTLGYIESSLDPDANRGNSRGAKGVFQFMWNTAKQYGLQDRFSVDQSLEAVVKLTNDNASALKKAGFATSPENLYLAHQQGAAGTIRLLRAARGDNVNISARNIDTNLTPAMRDIVAPEGAERTIATRGKQRVAADFVTQWYRKFRSGQASAARISKPFASPTPTAALSSSQGDGSIETGENKASGTVNTMPGMPETLSGNAGVSGVTKAHSNVDLKNLTPGTKSALNRLTSSFGPVTVNSGYRSKDYNDNLRRQGHRGVARNSQHTYGKAVDISTSGMSPEQKSGLLEHALRSGFSSVGFYPSFMHFDTRASGATWGSQPTWAQPVMATLWKKGMSSSSGAESALPGSGGSNPVSGGFESLFGINTEGLADDFSTGLQLGQAILSGRSGPGRNRPAEPLSGNNAFATLTGDSFSELTETRPGQTSGKTTNISPPVNIPRPNPGDSETSRHFQSLMGDIKALFSNLNGQITTQQIVPQNANIGTDSIETIISDIGLHNILKEGL